MAAAPVPDVPEVADGFPSATSTGVPAGHTLVPWQGGLDLGGNAPLVTEFAGRQCATYDGYRFELTGEEQFHVGGECVVLRNSWFSTTGNVASIVIQDRDNQLLVVAGSTFDGGPFHARGVQGDYGDIHVSDSAFYRFGNAAVEMNDRSATATLTVEGCFMYEPPGWPTDLHVDGVQMDAGGALEVLGNTIIVSPFGDAQDDYDYVSNSAIGVGATLGDIGSVRIEGNLLAGGGRLIYLEEKDFRFLGTVEVRDNVLDQRFFDAGAIYGPLHPDGLPAALEWSGNHWSDGTPVDLSEALALSP